MPSERKSEILLQAVYQSLKLPVPPPEIMREFEEVLPGSAERFMVLAEKGFAIAEQQSSHRQAMERAVIKNNIVQSYLGQVFGFIIAMGGIGGAFYLVLHGMNIQGLTAFVGSLGALILANRGAVKRRDTELESKSRSDSR